jgi:nucleoside-diphosphate-sugar epimerase
MFSSTPSNPKTGGLDSNLVNDSTKLGTKHLIEFLRTQENRVTYLNTSSGGVKNYVSDFSDGDKSINNIYAEAKIEAEKILIREIKDTNIMFKSPRLYSFAGPGIPLDAHFAVGNFMLDALSKRDVVIKGSPDTIRSYLHPIDMTIQMIGCWLGKEKEIFPDIGSFFPISMANLAQTISNILGNGKVKVLNNNQNSSSYFPTHPVFPFNLENIELDESIRRWASWLILNK